MASSGADPEDTEARLSDVLLTTLRRLADAGEADEACRLAGLACAALRGRNEPQWQRFNVLMHRLIPKTAPVGQGWVEPPPRPRRDRSSS